MVSLALHCWADLPSVLFAEDNSFIQDSKNNEGDVTNPVASDFPLVNAANEESRTHQTRSWACEMARLDQLFAPRRDCGTGTADA